MAKKFVSNKDESIRLFNNPIFNLFSRVHWSTPLIFWVPIVIYSLYRGFTDGVSILQTIGLFVVVIVFWTLAEYLLHRFVFHYHATTEIGKRISFLTHGWDMIFKTMFRLKRKESTSQESSRFEPSLQR